MEGASGSYDCGSHDWSDGPLTQAHLYQRAWTVARRRLSMLLRSFCNLCKSPKVVVCQPWLDIMGECATSLVEVNPVMSSAALLMYLLQHWPRSNGIKEVRAVSYVARRLSQNSSTSLPPPSQLPFSPPVVSLLRAPPPSPSPPPPPLTHTHTHTHIHTHTSPTLHPPFIHPPSGLLPPPRRDPPRRLPPGAPPRLRPRHNRWPERRPWSHRTHRILGHAAAIHGGGHVW